MINPLAWMRQREEDRRQRRLGHLLAVRARQEAIMRKKEGAMKFRFYVFKGTGCYPGSSQAFEAATGFTEIRRAGFETEEAAWAAVEALIERLGEPVDMSAPFFVLKGAVR